MYIVNLSIVDIAINHLLILFKVWFRTHGTAECGLPSRGGQVIVRLPKLELIEFCKLIYLCCELQIVPQHLIYWWRLNVGTRNFLHIKMKNCPMNREWMDNFYLSSAKINKSVAFCRLDWFCFVRTTYIGRVFLHIVFKCDYYLLFCVIFICCSMVFRPINSHAHASNNFCDIFVLETENTIYIASHCFTNLWTQVCRVAGFLKFLALKLVISIHWS